MSFLKQLINQLRSGISRYIIAFYGSCVMFILTAFLIHADFDENLLVRLLLSVLFATILSITAQTVSLRYKFTQLNDLIQKFISALSAIPCFFLIHDVDNPYIILGYAGILISVAAATVYFLFTNENENVIVPYLFKNLLFAGFIGLIFFGGITLCVYAVNYLIYEFSDLGNYILTILAFAFQVLALNLFLSGLPHENEELHIPKAFKILVLYVAFPIYMLLIAVLYVYLGKILVTMNMPGGQINLFASFAALFFIFFRFTIVQYEYPVTRIFSRFGGYLMIPIMTAQAVAVYIRLNAYGITAPRYASLVLTAVALIFVIISLIHSGRYIRQVILVFIGVSILVSVTPLNIIDVPVYEQTARLERILVRNNMFSDDKITPNDNISDQDKTDIRSSYNYLIYQKKVPSYLTGNKAFNDLFGFEQSDYYPGNIRYWSHYSSLPSEFDISGYSRLIDINETGKTSNGGFIITADNIEYDLTDFILSLSETGNNNKDNTVIKYNLTDHILVYFKTIDCGINPDNTFQYYNFTGFVLIK